MRLLLAWLEPRNSGVQYTVRTRCPQCGREHITVFRLLCLGQLFVKLEHFFRYARHFDFHRLLLVHKLGATSELELEQAQ